MASEAAGFQNSTTPSPMSSLPISDLPETDLSGSELRTSEAENGCPAWNGRTSQPFSPWWWYRLSGGSNQASSDWVGDPASNVLETAAAATQKSSSGSGSDSDSDLASDANPDGAHCRRSDLNTAAAAANPPSPKVPSQLLGGVNRRWSLGGVTSSGGGGGGGGGMVTDNLDMLCLQSKLSLLESQREQNAVRCQQFVDMLRFAAEQAGEATTAEDARRGEVVGKKERVPLPVEGLAWGGRRRLNRRRSTSDLLEARRRACAAGLAAGRVDLAGLPGCCAARNRIDCVSHGPKGSDNSSVSSEAPERSPEESLDGSEDFTTRGASGGVCSRSWTTGRLSQASLSATLHQHLVSKPMERKLRRGRTHDGRTHVERNHGARVHDGRSWRSSSQCASSSQSCFLQRRQSSSPSLANFPGSPLAGLGSSPSFEAPQESQPRFLQRRQNSSPCLENLNSSPLASLGSSPSLANSTGSPLARPSSRLSLANLNAPSASLGSSPSHANLSLSLSLSNLNSSLSGFSLSPSLTNMEAVESSDEEEIDDARLFGRSRSSSVRRSRSNARRSSSIIRAHSSLRLGSNAELQHSVSSQAELADRQRSIRRLPLDTDSCLAADRSIRRIPSYGLCLPPLDSRRQILESRSPSSPIRSHTYPKEHRDAVRRGMRSYQGRTAQTYPVHKSMGVGGQGDVFARLHDDP